ncbi:MAG: hypothetical protein Kow001_14780 [Acidobacteriota bacterium]
MRGVGILLVLGFGVLAGSVPAGAVKDPKLSEDDLVAAHRQAMGAVDARRSVVAKGICQLTILAGGSGQMQGPATFYAEGDRTMTVIEFGHGNYNGERFGFDGDKAQVAFMVPGSRSPLGEFLFSYQELLRQGLVGGGLSTAWPLLASDLAKRGRLRNEGIKEQDGERLLKAEFRPRRSTPDLNVDLFFDPETFRLSRSEYRVRIPASLGTRPDGTAGRPSGRDTQLKLEERYGQYREVEGVQFPTEWTVRMTTEDPARGTSLWEWKLLFTEVAFNQSIDPAVFSLR